MGNGTQVFHQFCGGHTDPRIRYGQGMFFIIHIYIDFQRDFFAGLFPVGKAFIAVFFQGIGGIRNQLPQENLTIRIKRVYHNVEKLFNFRLKFPVSSVCCTVPDIVFTSKTQEPGR